MKLPEQAFELLNAVAWQLATRGQSAAAIDVVEQQRAWVLTQGPRTQADFHLILAGVLGFSDQLLQAIASGEDALATLRAAGVLERTLPVLNNIGLYRWWRGELDAAKAVLLEASALRDRMHGSGAALTIDVYLGAVLRDRGEFAAALALLSRVLQQSRQVAEAAGLTADLTDCVIIENHLADLWLRLGRPDDAQAVLLTQDAAHTDVRFQARRAGLSLRLARAKGLPRTLALERALGLAQTVSSPFNRVWLELELGRELPPPEALVAYAELADCAPARQRPGMELHAALRAGQAALACGLGEAASLWCQRASALNDRCQAYDMDRAEVFLILGQLLAASGQPRAAWQSWQDGAQWLRRTATHQLEPAWHDGFLHGHPIHRALLQAADVAPA